MSYCKSRDVDEEIAQMIQIQKNRQTIMTMQSAPKSDCPYVKFKINLLVIQNEVEILQLRKDAVFQYQRAGLLPHKLVCSGDIDYWQEVKGIWEELIFNGKYADTLNNWRHDMNLLTERVESMLFCYRERIKSAHYRMENNIPHNSWINMMGMDRKVVLDQILEKFADDARRIVNLMDELILVLHNMLPNLIKNNLRGLNLDEILCDINNNIIDMVTL